MASPSLNHFEVEQLKADIVAAAQDNPVPATEVFKAFASTDSVDHPLSIPSSEGRKPAKGAMIAIAVEAAAVLCIYAVWQLWHLLR